MSKLSGIANSLKKDCGKPGKSYITALRPITGRNPDSLLQKVIHYRIATHYWLEPELLLDERQRIYETTLQATYSRK